MEANGVYDILVAECGASSLWRERFLEWWENGKPGGEWRFGGDLGFGGKYYSDINCVAYYVEEKSNRRDEMVRRANESLQALAGGG